MQMHKSVALRVLGVATLLCFFDVPAHSEDPAPAIRSAIAALDPTAGRTESRYALADLNEDGQADAVVLMGGSYCGSGGCTLFILRGRDNTYSSVGRATVVREPISVLRERSDGWHSLAVGIGGGGLRSAIATLPFSGKRYASNPSLTRRATAEEVSDAKTLQLVPLGVTP